MNSPGGIGACARPAEADGGSVPICHWRPFLSPISPPEAPNSWQPGATSRSSAAASALVSQAQRLVLGGHRPGDPLISKAPSGGLVQASMLAADSGLDHRFPAKPPAFTPHQERHARAFVGNRVRMICGLSRLLHRAIAGPSSRVAIGCLVVEPGGAGSR